MLLRHSLPESDVDERQARIDLAALYRLFAHFGWSDLTYTHISARVPGQPDQFFINAYGLLFDEITASSLVKIEFDGSVIEGTSAYNKAGHLIHTAVLQARPEINYVLHSHTRAGAALSALRCGLLPISQPANVVLGTVAYHTYAVAEEDERQCARLAADLGDKYVMVLHNHGLLACGRTAAEAFLYHHFLQAACEIQMDVLRTGGDYLTPPDEEREKLASWSAPRERPWGTAPWAALIRMLDRQDPSFRD